MVYAAAANLRIAVLTARPDRPPTNSAEEAYKETEMFRGSNKAPVAALVLLTLAVRGGALWLTPDALAGDPDGYRQVAANLLDHGVLGHGDLPTARRPPLYPLLLTPCLALGPWSRVAIGLLHVGLGLATVLLVYRLGREGGLGRFALLAAAMVACDPILLRQSTQVMTETPAALLTVAALIALTRAARRPTAASAAVAGGCLALGALCRPELLVWGALCAVLLPAVATKGTRRLALLGSMLGAAALVLAPWAVRNWVQLGRPIITTTHGGYTLLLGNNPQFYDYLQRSHPGDLWAPGPFHESWCRRLVEAAPDGEPAADRLAYADAWANMARQPGMFLYASVVRVGRLWQLAPHRPSAEEPAGQTAARWAIAAWYVAEFVLAILGLWVISRGIFGGRAMRVVLLWGVVLAGSFTAVHLLYWTNMRMRGPLMPAIALAAAGGAAWLTERIVGPKSFSDNELVV